MENMDREVIYVADPCCSWCWGFSPTINTLRDEYGGDVQFSLLMGGLRVGAHHIREGDRLDYVQHIWAKVGDVSGQPFTVNVDKLKGKSENTEPSCRAVVAMRDLAPEKSFSFLKRLQHSFFAENKDISDLEVLADLAAEEGAGHDDFLARLKDPEVKARTQQEFDSLHQMGVNGYPTTIVRNGEDMKILSAGYRPMENVRSFFEYWMTQEDAA